MSSPAKDLPKIADSLKGEILAERSLKPTEAQEKNVLPSADDVKQEKNHQNIMTGTGHRLTDIYQIYHVNMKQIDFIIFQCLQAFKDLGIFKCLGNHWI